MALLILLCIPLLPWKVVWFFHCCKTNRTKRVFFTIDVADCSYEHISDTSKQWFSQGHSNVTLGEGVCCNMEGMLWCEKVGTFSYCWSWPREHAGLWKRKAASCIEHCRQRALQQKVHWGRRSEIPHTQLLHPHYSYPHWFQMPMPTLTSTLSTKGTGFSWVWQILTNAFNSREQPKAEKNK